MKSIGYIISVVLICALSTPSSSQSPDFGFPTNNQISSDSTKTKFFTIFQGNPGKAALYSLLLPGAGQLYNKRWWKVPLVYALEGTAVYMYIDNRRLFNQIDACYTGLIVDATNPPAQCTLANGRVIQDQNTAFSLRNSARNTKEAAFLFSIGAHLFQTLEAFIDRHLIDFDVDEDLTFKLGPTDSTPNLFDNQTLNILTLSIPLGK